jgi:uncharacterized protein (TIGR02246 family)
MAGGCLPITPGDDQEALRAELAIRTLMAAWESADAAAIEELFWPDAIYDDYPNQHTHQGAQEIVEYVMALHAWADDVYFNVGDVHVTRTGAVAEWIFSAVQARPMGADLTRPDVGHRSGGHLERSDDRRARPGPHPSRCGLHGHATHHAAARREDRNARRRNRRGGWPPLTDAG